MYPISSPFKTAPPLTTSTATTYPPGTNNCFPSPGLLLVSSVLFSLSSLYNYSVWLFVTTVHGILQARILEWVALSFSRGFSQPRAQARVSHIVDRRFTVWATRKSEPIRLLKKWKSLSLVQLFVTTVHGILQGRILEWVDIPFFRGSSGPRSQTQFSCIAGGFFTILNKRKQEENSLAS